MPQVKDEGWARYRVDSIYSLQVERYIVYSPGRILSVDVQISEITTPTPHFNMARLYHSHPTVS
jgi:hypothetical protein